MERGVLVVLWDFIFGSIKAGLQGLDGFRV